MARPTKRRPVPTPDLGTPPSRPVAWWWTPNGNPQNAPRVVTAQTWFAARALARAEAARLLNLFDCDVSVWMKEAM